MSIAHVNQASFANEVESDKGLVLVDFYANWCAPCRALAPVLEEVAETEGAKVKIAKVDVDENGGLAMRFGVRGIPTLILFREGRELDRIVGYVSKAELASYLDSVAVGSPQ